MNNMKENKLDNFLALIVAGIIFLLIFFVGYKVQEFKLEHVWGIKDPTVMQIIFSMGK